MKNIDYMTFNEDDLSAKLNYSENYTQYTILNIPGSYKESDLLKLFSITSCLCFFKKLDLSSLNS